MPSCSTTAAESDRSPLIGDWDVRRNGSYVPSSRSNLFVLALHPEIDLDLADHRDALQWQFQVLEASTCPRRTITLETVKQRTTSANIEELPAALTWARETLRTRLAEEDKQRQKAKRRPRCIRTLEFDD